jgi:3-deoxy-D-manno-octulosonate 8-phosphate phosphatase (KDO 8-P phosphatase)
MKNILDKAANIRLILFDVDGVLTDGNLFIGADDGQEYKAFYVRDGMGMKILQATGVVIGIITAKTSSIVTNRMRELGIQYVLQGQQDKLAAFNQLRKQLQLEPQQVAYVGDDINDIPVMLQVGLAIAVADAHFLVIKHAHWQTKAVGGRGAAREACELIMQAQGTLAARMDQYGIII